MFKISSPKFKNGDRIPTQYTGEGEDLSPPLKWIDVPTHAKELVLIFEDKSSEFVHWVAYGLEPFATNGMPEGIQKDAIVRHPVEALQGMNSFGKIGYYGPFPSFEQGKHHYQFRLYALDARLKIAPSQSFQDVCSAMKGHILAESQLLVTFESQMSDLSRRKVG